MTVSGDSGKGNPFKSLTQRIGKLFSKGHSSEAPALLNDIIGASSGIMGDVQNMHKQSSHNSAHHGKSHHNEHDNHSSHGAHAEYQFSPYFERAVELINTAAGLIVMASVILAGINIILVALNANFGKFYENCYYFYEEEDTTNSNRNPLLPVCYQEVFQSFCW